LTEYAVIYEQAEDGSWGAYVPDLPGCVSGGDTREEVEANMAEAIPFHLAGLRETGRNVPKPHSFAGVVAV